MGNGGGSLCATYILPLLLLLLPFQGGAAYIYTNVILAPRGCITDKFLPANAINVIIITTAGERVRAYKCNKNCAEMGALSVFCFVACPGKEII